MKILSLTLFSPTRQFPRSRLSHTLIWKIFTLSFHSFKLTAENSSFRKLFLIPYSIHFMSTEESNTSNTERFSEMLRRSSARLRGGSVPPLDSEQTVNPPLGGQSNNASTATSPGGRGRGRGRRNAKNSARPAIGGANSGDRTSANPGEGTPAVTLTIPGSNGNSNSTPAPASTSEGQGSGPKGPARTSLIHPPGSSPAGLISKDNVGNNANGKHPSQLPTQGDAANAKSYHVLCCHLGVMPHQRSIHDY